MTLLLFIGCNVLLMSVFLVVSVIVQYGVADYGGFCRSMWRIMT